MDRESTYYDLFKFGVLVIFIVFVATGTILDMLDRAIETVFQSESVYTYTHSNLLEWKFIKWITNLLVGGYTLVFIVFLIKELFVSLFIEKEELNVIHIIGSIYTLGVFWLGLSFIFSNNYGFGAFIWSIILIVIPFLFLKLQRTFGFF